MEQTNAYRRRWLQAGLGTGSALALGAPFARAQGYPSRPVKVVVGAAPGGPSDFLGRMFGDAVGPVLGQSFVIENKAGASGTLAAEAASRAPADGHALLVNGPASMTVAPHIMAKLGYDPVRDFVPVAALGAGAFVLVVHPSVPVNNVRELVEYARARPDTLLYGSGGIGSSGHLCTESFAARAGVKLRHVPYKGDGPARNDLLGGQINMMFTAPNVAVPAAKAGKLRALAVTSRERVPAFADLPTVHESGFPDFEYLGWIVVFAPKGTPAAAMDRLSAAWAKASAEGAPRQRLEGMGMRAPERLTTRAALQAFLDAENERTAKLVRELGIKPQ